MSTAASTDELQRMAFSAADLAKSLGVSVRHLRAMHSSGRLGPMPLAFGRSKRWRAKEISDWLEAGAPSRDKWEKMRQT